MHWLQRACAHERSTAPQGPSVAFEDVPLTEFIREASFWLDAPIIRIAAEQSPVDTEFAKDQSRGGIVSALVRAMTKGMPTKKLFLALTVTLGLASNVALSLINEARGQQGQQSVLPADVLEGIPDSGSLPQIPFSKLPFGTPPPRKKKPSAIPLRDGVPRENVAPRPASEVIATYLAGHEGIRRKVYPDSKEYETIGIGHRIVAGDREVFRRLFGPAADVDGILAGRVGLTDEQIKVLFTHDSAVHLKRAKNLFRDFDSWPAELQAAIVSGVYRGDLSGSPKAIALINQGKWAEAAVEYLDHEEYLNTKRAIERGENPSNAGIVRRMEENAQRFKDQAS